jgi:KaiC domain protein
MSSDERKYNIELIEESIISFKEAGEKAPKLEGVPTGVQGFDDLFYRTVIEKGRAVVKALGGIPRFGILNITGVADTGKSLFVEQYAITQAKRGEKVAFITVESPANFVAMGVKERARIMGVKEEDIDENLIFIDAASHGILRENLPSLLNTLAHVIKKYKTKHTVIDSVTGLYEHKEMAARSIVRSIFNFLKKWYQTALLVSQKRSGHEELSAEAAGGYAVAHIVDGTIVFSKELIETKARAQLYGKDIGEIVRVLRIDGCRLTAHSTKVHLLEILESGIIKVGPPIGEIFKRSLKR